MNEATVSEKINALLDLLKQLPKNGSAKEIATEGTYLPTTKEDKTELDQRLDKLRMNLKYMIFDLEATKRENRYLRQMLETRFPPKPKGGSDSSL